MICLEVYFFYVSGLVFVELPESVVLCLPLICKILVMITSYIFFSTPLSPTSPSGILIMYMFSFEIVLLFLDVLIFYFLFFGFFILLVLLTVRSFY